MNQKNLESYLWGAATNLRGTIDAGDYKQYIFPLLFFKRISDVYDEEYENALKKSDNDQEFASFKENYRFIIPKGSHWIDVRNTTTNIGIKITKSLRNIELANPDTLYGIFGDANWTNKNRLSDEILINLIEHFSKQNLNIKNVPNDQLGNAYEYLIRKFADDSGHTAAEFYTNRTVVDLMTKIMNPKPGDSIYDPTCGSGGLLLNCALKIKNEKKEYRSLKLYGQEINLITSSIARMNMILHGIDEFKIERGDTIDKPLFIEEDQLKKFDIILANPPYSIKSWNQKKFLNDSFGRNYLGIPPAKCADYAFQQHILKSLKPKTGRSITLWPHGILFRDAESKIRKKMVESDLVECVIGLGPNLFYNSPMESCLLVTRNKKNDSRKGKILIINALKEVKQYRNLAFLESKHIEKIFNTYKNFEEIDNFSKIINIEKIIKKDGSLNIAQYVSNIENEPKKNVSIIKSFNDWMSSSVKLKSKINNLIKEIS